MKYLNLKNIFTSLFTGLLTSKCVFIAGELFNLAFVPL